MSPARIEESDLVVTPLKHTSDKKCTFGATVTGIDLNNLSEADLQTLKEATHHHQVVIIKNQHNLEPIKQWELVTRLDPKAPQVHGHGTLKQFAKTGGLLATTVRHGIPSAPNVRLIGKGYQGEDHYGIKDYTAVGMNNDWHAQPPSAEAFAEGNTQFQRWHMDAPLYEREPPHFTALRAITLPKGPDVTVNWDDGSGLSMTSRPGQTAFWSSVQLYEMLTEEEKLMVDNSWVEYAPFPYMRIEKCKGNSTGLGLVMEGKEHKIEEMPEWDPKHIKTYPMVWVNPEGKKALQVHGIAVHKLFLKTSPDSEVTVIDEMPKVHEILHKLQYRIMKPEYILVAPVEEGDVLMWDNWSMFHTAIDYPDHYGVRTMHQVNLGASDRPVGPVPIPVA